MSNLVSLELAPPLAIVQLRRPQRRNALTGPMVEQLATAFDQINTQQDIRITVLMAEGDHFCAGADLSEGYEPGIPDARALIIRRYKPLLTTIANLRTPVIAAVPGISAGAGASLALACDLVLMEETASLALSFVDFGLVADCGMSWYLVDRLGRHRAFEWLTDGTRISAADCLQAGLCNRVVPPGQGSDAALAWARELSERAPLSLTLTKRLMRSAATVDVNTIIEQEAGYQAICESSNDFREARAAFNEKRQPHFEGR